MRTSPTFDHEKLDVYQVAIQFVAWAGDLLEDVGLRTGLSAVKQLDAASTSVPLNIAEGNGKRSTRDRCRFFDIAKASALECAACLDVLVARSAVPEERNGPGKALLVRIVEMLTKLISRLLGPDGPSSHG